MTEKRDDPLTERVNRINGAVMKLSEISYNGLVATKPEAVEKQDLIDIIQSIGILVGSITISLSEIADSVGKLACQGEADFKSAVDAAVEQKANDVRAEQTKRSFIGQSNKKGY